MDLQRLIKSQLFVGFRLSAGQNDKIASFRQKFLRLYSIAYTSGIWPNSEEMQEKKIVKFHKLRRHDTFATLRGMALVWDQHCSEPRWCLPARVCSGCFGPENCLRESCSFRQWYGDMQGLLGWEEAGEAEAQSFLKWWSYPSNIYRPKLWHTLIYTLQIAQTWNYFKKYWAYRLSFARKSRSLVSYLLLRFWWHAPSQRVLPKTLRFGIQCPSESCSRRGIEKSGFSWGF